MRLQVLAAALILSLPSVLVGQELKCNVVVSMEGISPASRDNLRTFESDVQRYLNSTRFSNEDMLGDKIECTVNIFFKTAPESYRYSAQLFVGSQRPVYDENTRTSKISPVLRILDERVEFTYIPGQRMIQDDLVFDPLTDLLDYYAYLIIGFDLETYTPRAGERYFQKALNICNLAQSSAYSATWQLTSASYSRFGLSDELAKTPFDPFRAAFTDYHFDGIDILASKPDQAKKVILKSLATIARIRQSTAGSSVVIKQFFDAKFKEIADLFLGDQNLEVFDQLSSYDPEHRSTYQEYKQKAQ